LFSDEQGQGSLAALPRAEQGGNRVYLKRGFDLADGFWSGNHVAILTLEIRHINC
jgi:hypothetical protein